MRFRSLHRWLARISLVFIAVSVVTGLLWAYAPHMYWRPGYMAVKHETSTLPLDAARIKLDDALTRLVTHRGKGVEPLSASLRSENGNLLYTFRYRMGNGAIQASLMDAISGNWLSPLTEGEAIRFARQYVEEKPAVEDVTFLSAWIRRKAKTEVPVWRIRFADSSNTEIFIDPYTGNILEDQDTSRKFHFWVMKLHQFQFFGTNKELTIVAGLPLFMLLVTGAWLAFPKFIRRFKRRL